MQKSLIELIAKRARTKTYNLTNEFVQIETKIRSSPKNIEELTELNEFIAQLPQRLEKSKEDINQSMEVYQIMEEFQYKFSVDDINRKWQVYSYPSDIYELIEARKVLLKKEKTRFYELMITEQ